MDLLQHISSIPVTFYYQWHHIINNLTLKALTFFVYKPWGSKGFFQFEIIRNVLVNSSRFISIPMLWGYKYFQCGIDFRPCLIMRCKVYSEFKTDKISLETLKLFNLNFKLLGICASMPWSTTSSDWKLLWFFKWSHILTLSHIIYTMYWL